MVFVSVSWTLSGVSTCGKRHGLLGTHFWKYYWYILYLYHFSGIFSYWVYLLLQITLVTVLLCFLNPYVRMSGPELIYHLFSECQGNISVSSNLCLVDRSSAEQAWRVSQFLFMAMIMKGLLTVVTFGLKVPCGIFIPSLGVGACAGRILGIWIQWMQYREPHLGDISRSCEERGDCMFPSHFHVSS